LESLEFEFSSSLLIKYGHYTIKLKANKFNITFTTKRTGNESSSAQHNKPE